MITAAKNNPRLGVGIYSIVDAARLIGATPAVIRSWCRESERLIPRTLKIKGLLTFTELMELHFIKRLSENEMLFFRGILAIARQRQLWVLSFSGKTHTLAHVRYH